MLEITVRAEADQLAPTRHRIQDFLVGLDRSTAHIWSVTMIASELLTLSMQQGNEETATIRLSAVPDATRVELVDVLQDEPAFDSDNGRLVARLASISGVMRDPDGTRTVWCDVKRDP